ncbi:hypothetical protein ABKV19_016796 [Rosa sericea]
MVSGQFWYLESCNPVHERTVFQVVRSGSRVAGKPSDPGNTESDFYSLSLHAISALLQLGLGLMILKL